jgi:hypothetical protein
MVKELTRKVKMPLYASKILVSPNELARTFMYTKTDDGICPHRLLVEYVDSPAAKKGGPDYGNNPVNI